MPVADAEDWLLIGVAGGLSPSARGLERAASPRSPPAEASSCGPRKTTRRKPSRAGARIFSSASGDRSQGDLIATSLDQSEIVRAH